MDAKEARKLSHDHSKRMQTIFKSIAESAKKGNTEVYLNSGEATSAELEVLKTKGFTTRYETSETDGGQFIVVKW